MSKLNKPLRVWHALVAVVAAGALAVGGTALAGGSSKSASDAAAAAPKVNLGSAHGLTYRSLSDSGIGPLGGQFVKCPNKQSATGGGAYMTGPTGDTWLDASAPDDGPDADSIPDDGWHAYGDNASGTSETLTTFVICQHK
jgi:hypothetical protein